MAKDLSKYIFDVDNPKGFKAYGLLKKIFKDQNILLVIDLFFFNEIFKDIIWTEDVIEEIWDKPDNFLELSSNEKMEVYVDRFSEIEYYEILQHKSPFFNKNIFLKTINSFVNDIEYRQIQQYHNNSGDYVHYYECDIKTTSLISIDISTRKIDKIVDFIKVQEYHIKNHPAYEESELELKIHIDSDIFDVHSNILFLSSKQKYLEVFKYFNVQKSSVLITLFNQKKVLENNIIKLPQNTHPIILKKPEYIHQLLENVMRDAKITRLTPKNDVPKAYLKKVQIKNYYTIKNITLNKIYNKKEIYILGENGDGKTLLLQAILMAAKWQQIDNSDLEITGIIHQQVKENKDLVLRSEDTNKQKYDFPNAESSMQNIFAYGVNRQENNADTDEYGYMTLFKKDAYLQEPTKWLQYLHTKDLERKSNEENIEEYLNLDKAKRLLNNLLEEKVDIKVTADKVRFTERGSENVKFEQLSDGYKSILIWVCDLVSRLSRNQPNVTELKHFHGVVLVDEVGLHLHPKWEATLVQKLRGWFPDIQFIFTTHSPIILLNASKDAVVYRLYKEEGVTKISDQYQCSELSDLMLNGLITSPLFDLESATMRFHKADEDDLDTSDDFRLGRLRKLVDEEYQALKASGKAFVSPSEIDEIIKKAMKEN